MNGSAKLLARLAASVDGRAGQRADFQLPPVCLLACSEGSAEGGAGGQPLPRRHALGGMHAPVGCAGTASHG